MCEQHNLQPSIPGWGKQSQHRNGNPRLVKIPNLDRLITPYVAIILLFLHPKWTKKVTIAVFRPYQTCWSNSQSSI